MAKLTVSIDEEVIAGAKAYARARKTSLSKLVTALLRGLCRESRDPFFDQLHDELLREGYQPPAETEDELRRRQGVRSSGR